MFFRLFPKKEEEKEQAEKFSERNFNDRADFLPTGQAHAETDHFRTVEFYVLARARSQCLWQRLWRSRLPAGVGAL